jgi:hypothetical protein
MAAAAGFLSPSPGRIVACLNELTLEEQRQRPPVGRSTYLLATRQSRPLGVAAVVALRGCPMCWTVGLVVTLSQGRRDSTAERANRTWLH